MVVFSASISDASYGELPVVDEVTVVVRSGEALALLGANGAGKSTTLKAFMGAVRARDRRLSLGDTDLTRHTTAQLSRAGVVYVPDGAKCFPSLTVKENLVGAGQAVADGDVTGLLGQVMTLFPVLASRTRQMAGTMSGGERQMLAVGRALMMRPQVLLLDEPSAGLAPIVFAQLFEALAEIRTQGTCALVIAEQNVELALRVADRYSVLSRGHVNGSGAAADVGEDTFRSAYLGSA